MHVAFHLLEGSQIDKDQSGIILYLTLYKHEPLLFIAEVLVEDIALSGNISPFLPQ